MSLRRILCQPLPTPDRPSPLSEDEAQHLTRVLRLRPGDSVQAIDGHGHACIAQLARSGSTFLLEFASACELPAAASVPVRAVLEVSVLKGQAMEWLIEKAVELGVDAFVPYQTAHSVVRIAEKGPAAFQARWEKVATQSLKQCGRLQAMEIVAPRSFSALDPEPRFWCDESAGPDCPHLLSALMALKSESLPRTVRVLIGPEGGWSAEERAMLTQLYPNGRVTLGPLTLRAETAGVAVCALIQAAFSV